MTLHHGARLLRYLMACIALAGSSSALAALGGDAGSVATDRVVLAAQLRSTATGHI